MKTFGTIKPAAGGSAPHPPDLRNIRHAHDAAPREPTGTVWVAPSLVRVGPTMPPARLPTSIYPAPRGETVDTQIIVTAFAVA